MKKHSELPVIIDIPIVHKENPKVTRNIVYKFLLNDVTLVSVICHYKGEIVFKDTNSLDKVIIVFHIGKECNKFKVRLFEKDGKRIVICAKEVRKFR